jgi:hypothetical protein
LKACRWIPTTLDRRLVSGGEEDGCREDDHQDAIREGKPQGEEPRRGGRPHGLCSTAFFDDEKKVVGGEKGWQLAMVGIAT